MRTRDIKPRFYLNDQLAECSFAPRLAFPGLWMIADRNGRLEYRPKRFRAEIFPYDQLDMEELLAELERNSLIVIYDVDGKKYIWIPTFLKHQKPHPNEKDSVIPPCPLEELSKTSLGADSAEENFDHSSTKEAPTFNHGDTEVIPRDDSITSMEEPNPASYLSSLTPDFKNFKDTNVSLSSPPAPDASNPPFLNLPETTASKPPSALASYFNRLPGNDPESSAEPEGEFDEPRGEYEPPNKANIPKPDGKSAIPLCPHKRIIAAYHEELPELPQVKVWEGARVKRLAARWKERCLAGKYQSLEDGLAYWRRLFRHIRANCPFLMGRVETRDGRAFYADLAWLPRPENFAKLIEGKYDKKAVAA